MTAQNQRDPDGTDILGQVRDGLADLKANVISRWGRVPTLTADPATLVDGQIWVRNDAASLAYRANGVTLDGAFVTTFIPQIDQGATTNITKTITKCQWRYDGPWIDYEGFLIVTGAGTVGAQVTVTLPVVAVTTANASAGTGMVFNNTTSTRYVCQIETTSTTQFGFGPDQSGASGLWGLNPATALAANFQLRWLIRYRWL